MADLGYPTDSNGYPQTGDSDQIPSSVPGFVYGSGVAPSAVTVEMPVTNDQKIQQKLLEELIKKQQHWLEVQESLFSPPEKIVATPEALLKLLQDESEKDKYMKFSWASQYSNPSAKEAKFDQLLKILREDTDEKKAKELIRYRRMALEDYQESTILKDMKKKAHQRKVFQFNFKSCVAQKYALQCSQEELKKIAGPITTQESLPDDMKDNGALGFLSTQDGKQKVTYVLGQVYEIYKLTIASLLLLFVPMACYPCAYPAYTTVELDYISTITGEPYNFSQKITLTACDGNGAPPDIANSHGDFPYKLNSIEQYRDFCASYESQADIDNCLAGDSMVTCSVSENIGLQEPVWDSNVAVNFIALVAFLFMYAAEYAREMKLIAYMEVNPEVGNTNDEVAELLQNKLPQNRIDNLELYDNLYFYTGVIAILCFLGNCGFSAYNIFQNYLDTTTITTFLTSISLMATKVNNVYSVVNTEKSVFYSANQTQKVQYNDVDPDKAIEGET
jgi:hypothetical protein